MTYARSLDARRGLVFVPTGSAASDFYGANRLGSNLYANCLLAIEAATGKLRWHFQFVKHDILDRDLPTAPTLVTLRIKGKRVDAVAQHRVEVGHDDGRAAGGADPLDDGEHVAHPEAGPQGGVRGGLDCREPVQ